MMMMIIIKKITVKQQSSAKTMDSLPALQPKLPFLLLYNIISQS